MFRTSLGETVFKQKYASNPYETWADRAHTVVNYVCGDVDGDKNNLMSREIGINSPSIYLNSNSCLVVGTCGTQEEMRGSLIIVTC